MPRLRKPASLLMMADNVLIDYHANYCHECSVAGSLDKLRRWVAFIKEEVGPQIPCRLAAGFYGLILDRFLGKSERPESHKKAMLEMIMDRKISRLSISCSDFESMDLNDAHRIQGLEELLLDDSRCYNLNMFHLGDLTSLTYCVRCTDADLEIIGKNCPKLEQLNMNNSEHVTDPGLRALRPCLELCHVELRNCPKITHTGIQGLLSAHGKLQALYALSSSFYPGFDCFTHAGWSVYPLIKEFEISLDDISNTDLRRVAVMFPNLIMLRIIGDLDYTADLRTLKSMKKLAQLDFRSAWGSFDLDNLKELLKLVGANITGLTTYCFTDLSLCLTQAYLDFLHEFCPNLEHLEFDYWAQTDGEVLVVPPFEKLVIFRCHITQTDDQRFAVLQFGRMLKLKMLTVCRVEITTEVIESMIRDNIKFPNLRCLLLDDVSGDCDITRIEEIAKKNNLEFFISNNSYHGSDR